MADAIKYLSAVNIARGAPDVEFGDVWYQPGGECGPRIQRDYQLVVVHLGEARVTFGDQACVIPPGSVALMLPGRREHFRFSRQHRTHHTWCAVRPGKVPASLKKRLARLPAVLRQSSSFQHLMQAAFGIGTWRKTEGRHMLHVLGLSALEEFVRMAEEGRDDTNEESPHGRALRCLEDRCGEEDCLRQAARAAAVTPQHLIRLFRQNYQTTPGRYLWQIRVEKGASLLAATGLTVAEIADRCGFKNPFHFSRLLRQMQGVSPRQLRQGAWVRKR